MVRTVHAETKHLNYLDSLAKSKTCKVGLIIGQHFEGNDYILHLAQTPVIGDKEEKNIQDIEDISEAAIAEHAKHTTRMLSGGLYVLGIFVIYDGNVLNPLLPKIKTVLQQMHSRLEKNQMMFGNCSGVEEKLVLHYSKKDESYSALTVNTETFNGHKIVFNFSDKDQQWVPIKCRFELNELISINSDDVELPLKKYMRELMLWVNSSLKSAVYLFNGEMVKGSSLVSSNLKRQRKSSNVFDEESEKVIHVDILLQTTGSALFDTTNISDSFGCFRVNGIVASNVWLNPNVSYSAVSNAINEDIIRSLSARLGMHFDSLTEGERGFFNDSATCVHEVPRRVLLPIPNSPVSFSDYLFPGEGPQEAEMAVQDVLDIQFINKAAISDVEGQADLSLYYNNMGETENEEDMPKLPKDTNKLMYMVGVLVAILILLISLLIHYFRI